MEYRIAIRKTKGKKLYVDPQEEEGFYLYPGEIRKAGLKEDMVISGDDLSAIHKEYAVPRARRHALGLLAKKDMTERELVEKQRELAGNSSLSDETAQRIASEIIEQLTEKKKAELAKKPNYGFQKAEDNK